MEWITIILANWDTIALAVGGAASGIIALASLIVRLTPTKKDDEAMSKVMGIINLIALNKKPK